MSVPKTRLVFGRRLKLTGPTRHDHRGYLVTAWAGEFTCDYGDGKHWHWRLRLQQERSWPERTEVAWALRVVGRYRPLALDAERLSVDLTVDARTREDVLRRARLRLRTALVACSALEEEARLRGPK